MSRKKARKDTSSNLFWSSEPIRRFHRHTHPSDNEYTWNSTSVDDLRKYHGLTSARETSSAGIAITSGRMSRLFVTNVATKTTYLTTTGPNGRRILFRRRCLMVAIRAFLVMENTSLAEALGVSRTKFAAWCNSIPRTAEVVSSLALSKSLPYFQSLLHELIRIQLGDQPRTNTNNSQRRAAKSTSRWSGLQSPLP